MMDAENPFDELPQALVDEMLGQCNELGDKLITSFNDLRKSKSDYRTKLSEQKMILRDSDLIGSLTTPTSCGVDGSYTVEKLLSTDMLAVAGVAVEGLIPPRENRKWEKPHHFAFVKAIAHDDKTVLVARAIMMAYELKLAKKAPHQVVFLDGSMTTPLIYFNQALTQLNDVQKDLKDLFLSEIGDAIKNYNEILQSKRTDKIYVSVPKYSTRKEVCHLLKIGEIYDDRGLLTFLLNSGEIISPITLEKDAGEEWHINLSQIGNSEEWNKIKKEIIDALGDIYVLYYKPKSWLPAMRLEVSKAVALNKNRLAVLIEALQYQCVTPSIMEPYPTYMADRMVKHLGKCLPAIRKATTQEMAIKWEGGVEDIYLAMHGYRTELGR